MLWSANREPHPTPEGVYLILSHLSGKKKGGIFFMMQTYLILDTKLSGQKLRAAIKSSGYTVKELQNMLCLSCPQPIYRWISCRTLPSIDNLYRLSRILNTSMEDLLAFKQVNIVDTDIY